MMTKEIFKQLYLKGIDVLWNEVDMELARHVATNNRLKKHDRQMRDDAHKFNFELKSYKSRKCQNCKHIKGIKPKLGQIYCDKNIEDLNHDMGVELTFYCNKWESNETT